MYFVQLTLSVDFFLSSYCPNFKLYFNILSYFSICFITKQKQTLLLLPNTTQTIYNSETNWIYSNQIQISTNASLVPNRIRIPSICLCVCVFIYQQRHSISRSIPSARSLQLYHLDICVRTHFYYKKKNESEYRFVFSFYYNAYTVSQKIIYLLKILIFYNLWKKRCLKTTGHKFLEVDRQRDMISFFIYKKSLHKRIHSATD